MSREPERRRYRSDDELRKQRNELEHEWTAEQCRHQRERDDAMERITGIVESQRDATGVREKTSTYDRPPRVVTRGTNASQKRSA